MDEPLVSWKQFERPENILRVESFEVSESVSTPYNAEVKLFALKEDLSNPDNARSVLPENMVGTHGALRVQLVDGERFFNGIVTRFRRVYEDARSVHFEITMHPWFWLLSQASNCRVFQDMTTIEIVTQIFEERKSDFPFFVRYRDDTQEVLPKRVCCVQYRETDFDFISRLLEQDGIFYYFSHTQSEHKLVMCDSPWMTRKCPDQPTAQFIPNVEHQVVDEDYIQSWSEQFSLTPGRCALNDYKFMVSRNDLNVDTNTKFAIADNDKLEVYDYPGQYAQRFDEPDNLKGIKPEGERLVKIQMEEQETSHQIVHGSSNCRAFSSGYTFDVVSSDGAIVSSHLLTAIQHSVSFIPSDSTATGQVEYHNHFSCIPSDQNFRPMRRTPSPAIHSVQTARVVGPKDEEIWTDEHGRIKVQFHWDRYGECDDRSFCWVRLSQSWAGLGRGAFFWPRVGDEVVVAFLNGDPDLPLVVGSVHNDQNNHPYDPVEHKTRSGIKTRSTPDGEEDQFNEIRIEDKKGKEEIYVHAERKLATVVESGETRRVGASRSTTIGVDDKLVVKKGDREAEIEEGDDKLTIALGSREADILEGDDILFVQKGNVEHQAPLGAYRIEAREIHLTASEKIVIGCGGSSITLEPTKIEITNGASSVTLDPGSVTQQAVKISSQAQAVHEISGAIVKSEATATQTIKGVLVENAAVGTNTVKGGLVKLNC